MVAFCLVTDVGGRSRDTAVVIPYSQFQQLLEAGKVKEVTVDTESLSGELKK